MTVDLKTLEDLMEFGAVLEIRSTVDDSLKARYTPPYPAVTKVDLKHEAVKWVKALSSGEHVLFHYYGLEKFMASAFERRLVCDWIIDFFNLTEEDLK